MVKPPELIHAVISDVDGTIIRHGHKKVTPGVRRAIQSLEVPFMPATGRSYTLMQNVVEDLELQGLGLLDGGATIVDFSQGKEVWKQWLSPEKIEQIAYSLGSLCTLLSCQVDYKPFNPQAQTIDDFLSGASSPSVFAVYPTRNERQVETTLGAIPGVAYRTMAHEGGTLTRCAQVTDANVDKGSGAVQMLRKASLADKKVLAIGDGHKDDLALFGALKALGRGSIAVAMGNAHPELKRAADYTTASVLDDGFVTAMREYELSTSI